MCRPTTSADASPSSPSSDSEGKARQWRVGALAAVIVVDVVVSFVFLSPILSNEIDRWEGNEDNKHGGSGSGPFSFDFITQYSLAESLWDLGLLAVLRGAAALAAAIYAYGSAYRHVADLPPNHPSLFHPNGTRKNNDELEAESLELDISAWLRRQLVRPASACEYLALVSAILCIVKCLARLHVELGVYNEAKPLHPIVWALLAVVSVFCVLENIWVEPACAAVGKWSGVHDDTARSMSRSRNNSRMSLAEPLLGGQNDEEANDGDENEDENGTEPVVPAPVESDIGAEPKYRASWSDLLSLCLPDLPLIAMAFVFLLLAAGAQIYIPYMIGQILQLVADAYGGGSSNNDHHHSSISDIPGFMPDVEKLIVVSILCGVFSGLRGSIFTAVGGRVNVRLRSKLMDALLVQDIGFFDITKTGDITSRLSSDTTLVGDQITLNVNVFMRSLVQAIGVLMCMAVVSWQLTILAFISVPAITILSKWYGEFVRSLTKVMQKKLADGNAISEAALSSMSTVQAFDASLTEFGEFEEIMKKYLSLNYKSAVAYSVYATCATSLPQLVTSLIIFYGGLMVRNGDLSSGQLVSFLLYLQSLSDAFASIGYIFSSLTQAVGAADKVFELMHRKPRLKDPTHPTVHPVETALVGANQEARNRLTMTRRVTGLEPQRCSGEVVLQDVRMSYPARPERQILNGLSLAVPPGKVAALVGMSGGGKSSIISLIQHLYEHSSGKVMIDGNEVHELTPRWLSRHVSVVSQEPTLFARSIKRNIMYGLEGTELEPTLEDVKTAARLANADTFIEAMPRQYDTEVGERGVQLSGGQKQRIAIARALIRKPKLLCLDEATSALDAESEHMVQKAIDDMLAGNADSIAAGMTVLIVAHRLSTIRNADIIFVIKDGVVVEQGNHTELIKNPDGAYAALIQRQMNVQKQLDEGK